jgi:hypothetical protein
MGAGEALPVMALSAAFSVEVRAGVPVVVATGELVDPRDTESLRAALAQAEAIPSRGVAVALGDLEYLAARTFGVLTAFGARLSLSGRRLVVVCPPAHVSCRMVGVLGFPFRSVDTLEAAVAAVGESGPTVPGDGRS